MPYMYSPGRGQFSAGITNPAQNPYKYGFSMRPGSRRPGAKPVQATSPDFKPQQTSFDVQPGRTSWSRAGGYGRANFAPSSKRSWGGGGGGGGGVGGGAPQQQIYDYVAGPDVPDYVAGPDLPGGMTPAEYTAAQYTAFNPELWANNPETDTRARVDAARHYLDEEMMGNMAEASRRFGASGAIRSSGHRRGLTEAVRKRDRDLGEMYHRYDYQAAQADANRGLTAHQAHQAAMAAEAARKTGFSQSEAARKTGFSQGEAGRQDAYNFGIYDRGASAADRENAYNWRGYGAGMTEAQRREQYEKLKMMMGL